MTTEFTFLPKSPLEQKVKELHKKVHKIKDDELEEWGTLKSRATQMSVPVILVDDSAVAKAMADKDSDSNEDKKINDKDLKDEEAIDNPKPDDLHAKQTQEEERSDQDLTDLKSKDTPQPTLIDIPEHEGTRLIEQKQEEKPVEPIRTQTPAKPQQKTVKRPAIAKPRQQPKTIAKPKLSLAQLAQGFTDHMKHEGDYTISMSGNDSAKATESQLKIGRFLQRIIGSVQNAWRANANRYPLSHPVIISIHFTIVINKNGSLNKVGIDKSSGNQAIDNYIKLIIQDASTSFPAIPDYMSHDICSIRCTLDEIRLPEGPPGYTIRQ